MTKKEEYFKLYPDVEVFYFTSDGQAFFTEYEAHNHSVTVGDNEVIPVNREDIVETPAEPVVETPAEPVVEIPAEPLVETPAEPVVDTPTEPVVDTLSAEAAEEILKSFDFENDSPDYPNMKRLIKALNIEVENMKASTLLDALVAKKAELLTPKE